MNRIFRTLWSVTRQCWQAVPENAKSAGKGSTTANATSTASGSAGAVASFVLSFLIHSQVSAQSPPAAKTLPTGGVVAQGAATFSQTATAQAAALTVNQSSQRAVINWNTFNLGSAASVNFAQPNAQAVTLNRVSDANPSQIYGRITAPGQVFLSNPNGVYFSPTSQVDVGALTATTHSISDDDFMAGNYRFDRNGATGKVVNEGKLNAALGGYIALLAPEVQNAGVVVAQAGTVAMAAGELITLNLNGVGGLANITTTPSTIASLVENKHAVLAPDGQIVLSAVALNKLQAGVVKNSGSLEANSLVNKGGKIVLEGDDITLNRNSKIEAKGPTGGGTVLVGGDWQGSGDLRQATKVTMEAGATIDASATDKGDGGKVVLWSDVHNADSQTSIAGTVLAEGHGEKTLGGQIETSGAKLKIADSARISMGGVGASGGRWLLDPQDYTIAAAGGDITGAALGGSITAGNTVEILNSTGGTAGAGAGDIKVNDDISWNNSGVLKLSATGFVTGASNIAMTGGGGLIFNQAGDSTYSGVISGTGSFTKQGTGVLTLSGLNTYSGGSTISAGTLKAGSVTPLGSGAISVTNGASFDSNGKRMTSTGVLTLTGNGVGGTQGALLDSGTSGIGGEYVGPVTLGGDALIKGGGSGLTLSNAAAITGAHVLTIAGSPAVSILSPLGADLTGLVSNCMYTNLGGDSPYNGPITVTPISTLRFWFGGKLGNGNYLGNIVNNGTITDFNGTTTQTLSGVISGTGHITASARTLILTGANTFTGRMAVGATGTLVVGGAGSLNGGSYAGNIANAGTFRYASSANQTLSGVISGAGSFIKDTGTTSTLTLSGTNTFTGTLEVNAGTLRAASAAALGDTAAGTTVGSAGTLELSGPAAPGGLTIGAEALTVADGGTVHNISGDNFYDGAITLNGSATVNIDAGTSLNFRAVGAGVTVNSGKVLTLTTNGDLTFTQPLIGAGSYAKTGTGTLTSGAGSTLAVYVPPPPAPPAPPPDPALTNPEIVAMTPTQVAAISVTQFNLLTKAQMALFTPVQLAGMTNAQILMLTPTQMAGLMASQMGALSTAQLSTFSPTMVAGLSNDQLGGFTATQVQSLSNAQLAGLSAAQIAAMNPTNGVALSAAQLGALSVSQLTGLSAAQVGALSTQQLGGLTPAQLGSLSNAQLNGLSYKQVVSLTAAQLKGLTPEQLLLLLPEAPKPVPVATPPVAVPAVVVEPVVALKSVLTQPTLAAGVITIPAPLAMATGAIPVQSTGVLAITLLEVGATSRPAAVGVVFEQDANVITLKTLDVPQVITAPRIELPLTSDNLTSFTVTSTAGELVEFQGGLMGKRLMIVALTNSARQVARAEMKQVLAAAITTLGREQRVMLADLQGVVFDLR